MMTPSSASEPNTNIWPELLQKLLDRQSLSVEQASSLMLGWLTEAIPPVLSGAILAALQAKGISAEELTGMASILHSFCDAASSPELTTKFPSHYRLIDTCGTGGDGASTFNISTTVALVAAAANVPVAKHGNRSASSKVGSADVFSGLGGDRKETPKELRAGL